MAMDLLQLTALALNLAEEHNAPASFACSPDKILGSLCSLIISAFYLFISFLLQTCREWQTRVRARWGNMYFHPSE